MSSNSRRSSQDLLPEQVPSPPDGYRLYPTHSLPAGSVRMGFAELAAELATVTTVIIDGYVGNLWSDIRAKLTHELKALGKSVAWHDVSTALRPDEVLEALTEPFLGGDDPLFGTRFTGELLDFFDTEKLAAICPDGDADLNIIYGVGAACAGWHGRLIYLDVPKNEIQFRARAGAISNLGLSAPLPHKEMYKRFYFVDWIACNRHKEALLPEIYLVVDAQRPAAPAFALMDIVADGLSELAHGSFRARPWFEPGAWGGDWMLEHFAELPQDVPNYAWSFELITPENGVIFESDGQMLELSFDFLMYQDAEAIMGCGYARFGTEFPIRFDYLDTMNGGNLSLQCHPRESFIQEQFGERFPQDETYYMLEAADDACVYLGLQEGVGEAALATALRESAATGEEMAVERYVQRHPAKQHDLFLIPNGTIHCSGAGAVVLEISSTPYIFTFKLYDWLRLDLDGRPRPLNIDRGVQNIAYEREGAMVGEQLIAKPRLLATGDGWQQEHLPTHEVHFYDVHRYEITGEVEITTADSPHVLCTVAGDHLELDCADRQTRYRFGETFMVAAAANRYRLRNCGDGPVTVVVCFLKPDKMAPVTDLFGDELQTD